MRFLILLLGLQSLAAGAFAGTIVVRPGPNAIQNAIASAHRNDTLVVQSGIYKEHDIKITRHLTIIGNSYPIVDAESKYQGFIIAADSVYISGVQVQNTGRVSMTDMAGIRIVGAGHVTVTGNKLMNCTFGVYLQNAHDCLIAGNTIYSANKDEVNGGNGIHAWKCDHLQIKNNACSGQRDGIYFEFVTDSHISGNQSMGNLRYGLHFMFSHNDTYTDNTFKNNGAGVAVMYSKGVTMTGNEFVDNWGDASYGLLLKEISDSKIEHNRFIKNTVGIHMESTTRVDVRHCLFTDNGWALRVQASCSGSNFTENNFIGNSFDVATNGTLVLNTFNNNFWDKYDGYDLDRNNIGDVPYYPVSVYSVITEKIPDAMILYHSFLTNLMEQVEKVMPTLIPDKLKDDHPMMRKIKL